MRRSREKCCSSQARRISLQRFKSEQKADSVDLVKGAAMDSDSRVSCTPEEMNSASLEKEVIQSGGNHATPKEGGLNSAKIFYESYSLRQDKKENTEASNNPREEWFSWEKADIGEKEGIKSFLGEQIDSEGNRNRDQNVGLFYARLPNNEEEATSVQVVSAQNNPDLST
ncbi:hypothetical protein Ancab_019366, partial [Ancistrocladus abbreviatus]